MQKSGEEGSAGQVGVSVRSDVKTFIGSVEDAQD